ncbi:MAG: hypothetical protein GF331_21585 [Chitinivibrionales bacterium]|nr:hypothetical protein [Chitinivibrionales bacterium]
MSPISYNPEIHHRRSYRCPGHDYSRAGWYFVTICLRDLCCMLAFADRGACHRSNQPGRSCCRGRPCLRLTETGRIADQYWREIPSHAPNVELDEYVIMPDHMHGILRLTDCCHENAHRGDVQRRRDVQLNVPTGVPSPTPHFIDDGRAVPEMDRTGANYARSRISPESGTLSVVIRTYKGAVKTWANTNGCRRFMWQSRFHDHIIRSQDELTRIRWYILNNPGRLIQGRHRGEI